MSICEKLFPRLRLNKVGVESIKECNLNKKFPKMSKKLGSHVSNLLYINLSFQKVALIIQKSVITLTPSTPLYNWQNIST